MVKYVSINPNGELYSGTDNYDKIRFGSSGENAYITKVTVEYVGGEDPGPDPGTGPGTGGEAGQTTTIAQLAQGGEMLLPPIFNSLTHRSFMRMETIILSAKTIKPLIF